MLCIIFLLVAAKGFLITCPWEPNVRKMRIAILHSVREENVYPPIHNLNYMVEDASKRKNCMWRTHCIFTFDIWIDNSVPFKGGICNTLS
jgi:hypothetical protein